MLPLWQMWFRRPSQQPASPPSTSQYGPVATDTLVSAGWSPGRSMPVRSVGKALKSAGFSFHGAASAFLAELVDLAIPTPIDGHPNICGLVLFDPAGSLAFYSPTLISRLAGEDCCLVGTVSGHTMGLFLGASGQSYLFDREGDIFARLARSPGEAIEALCDGRNGRVAGVRLEDGELTDVIYQPGSDRERWSLDRLPDVASLLPPTSLEPACRPPDVLALCNTLQATAKKDANWHGQWTRITVGCGGMMASARRMWFVAHTENALFIRSTAKLCVAVPPPGMGPDQLRAGVITLLGPAPQ